MLTHTNVAIDLIKEKLGAEASKLFAYPNFFGTIQSFVDRFLAAQSLIEEYGKRPDRIDKEISNKKLENEFISLPYDSSLKKMLFFQIYASESKLRIKDLNLLLNIEPKESNKIIRVLKSKKILIGSNSPYNLNYSTNKKSSDVRALLTGLQHDEQLIQFLIELHKKAKETAAKKERQFELLEYLSIDWEHQEAIDNYSKFGLTTPSGVGFKQIKEVCFNDAIISYQDAYDFARYYLFKHPNITYAFQERFKFVFIDEMQDTASHQSAIINTLFKGSDKTIIQEFGDPNQAIYDYDGQKGEWKYDEINCLHLSKSKRFGDHISNVINPFRIKTNEPSIEGENQDSILFPHLIIFEKADKRVLDEFGRLIVKYGLHKIKCSKFAAIGRVGKGNLKGEITLKTYWDGFEKESDRKKEHFPTLIEYLANDLPDKKNHTERIINGILQLLEQQEFKRDIETNKQIQKRRFTKITLFDYLKKENEELYFEFRTFISDCGLRIRNSGENFNTEVYKLIIEFVNSKVLPIKSVQPNHKIGFLEIPVNIAKQIQQERKTNIYEYDDGLGNIVPIMINTIHGEKGETHTATLFLETYYNKKHDIERISEQLLGNKLKGNENNETQMAVKLAYVAMSRPEKLLCFAVSSERVKKEYAEEKLKPLGWEIIKF